MTTEKLPLIPMPTTTSRHEGGFEHECLICNKRMTEKAADKGYWVEMATSTQLIPNGLEEGSVLDSHGRPFQSQGGFPIGSECARKVPNAYKHKRPAV